MRLLVLLILSLLARCLPAQPTPEPRVLPEPQVNADHTVTFRYAAPTVGKVSLALEGTRAPLPMAKDEAGTWSVTTPALQPEWYSFHFNVDGRNALDPHDVIVKASYTAVGNGFLVPGEIPQPWETTAVPHGAVHHHTFTSKVVLGLERGQDEFYVYTPPGYDPRGAAKYPVLYLLHGWSDTAGGWANIGHANDILDNLIAQGKARPMIVVMPLGYGDMSFVHNGFSIWNKQQAVDHNTDLFSQSLLSEIVPQVERLYNVSARREDRAIAGLSMGGLESLSIGLTHSEQFAWVGGFSAAVHLFQKGTFAPPAAKNKFSLLWIACGTSDDLIEPNRNLSATLTAAGYQVTPIETPGAHTWLVWRANLVHFAPLLFQK